MVISLLTSISRNFAHNFLLNYLLTSKSSTNLYLNIGCKNYLLQIVLCWLEPVGNMLCIHLIQLKLK